MAQVPVARQRRRLGGVFDDPFFQNNPMFNDAFQQMSQPQQITIRSQPAELTVKPCPPRASRGASPEPSAISPYRPTSSRRWLKQATR